MIKSNTNDTIPKKTANADSFFNNPIIRSILNDSIPFSRHLAIADVAMSGDTTSPFPLARASNVAKTATGLYFVGGRTASKP